MGDRVELNAMMEKIGEDVVFLKVEIICFVKTLTVLRY